MKRESSLTVALVLVLGLATHRAWPQSLVERVGSDAGIVAMLGASHNNGATVVDSLRGNRFIIYFQSADPGQVAQVRQLGAAAGLLGQRLFVRAGGPAVIPLASNLADLVLVAPSAATAVVDAELLRVLRPRGTAFIGDRKLTKPVPKGIDDWSHPYHGPDNNPQSLDRLARGPLRTQFMAEPMFSPMPEQTVAAGGRLFKACGHIAHKANQNALLNTLLCINAYNGVILWKRALPENFMIHRNTMVATVDTLYMGGPESCKVIDARTGVVHDRIIVPTEITDGPVWKWMALRKGTLYALVGNREVHIDTQRSTRPGMGHWPWGMWQGHDYREPRTSFGFGRTLVAVDLATKKLRWHRRTRLFLDARALCMNSTRIFAYSPGNALMAFDLQTGKVIWRHDKGPALAAIGPNLRAQHYITGYATTCYAKCNDDYLFFAGPQRRQMVVVSAKTGDLAWTHPDGNLQLVLRKDAIYAAGPRTTGAKLDYATGIAVGTLPTRRACTRATGSLDSVFFRAFGGTLRLWTDSGRVQHIAPMRPPCQDGVLIANGHLYWGPWMCGCPLSLYGNICLGPKELPRKSPTGFDTAERTVFDDSANIAPLKLQRGDWPAFRGGNDRSDTTALALPNAFRPAWRARVCLNALPTAPVTGGDRVFIADQTGAVQAFDANGRPVWKHYTSGPVYASPAVAMNRVYVGSTDGCVYAFAARMGRLLWRFRVAPEDRRINVFGKLISRWPVAGGVVVQGNTVYAAAGIANFDGTYVVGLDAVTGKLKTRNSTSGSLAPKVGTGISLQGNLSIADGELRFLGGSVYETARYSLKTLACLNPPVSGLRSRFQTAFYPYYPEYGRFVSLLQATPHGILIHAAGYEGSKFGNVALQAASPKAVIASGEQARRQLRRTGRLPQARTVWQDGRNRRFTSFIVSDDVLLAAGHTAGKPQAPFLIATRVEDGVDLWQTRLPADAVKGGMAVDHAKRLFVALENGELLGFLPDDTTVAPASKTALPPPRETTFTFLPESSMRPFGKGTRMKPFPRQTTEDPMGPFSGKGVYFRQRNGRDTDVSYRIESRKPIREIHFRGAAARRMYIRLVDPGGTLILSSSGPFNEGNVYGEHTVAVPDTAGQRFILRFHNEATTWFYIEKLTLRRHGARD